MVDQNMRVKDTSDKQEDNVQESFEVSLLDEHLGSVANDIAELSIDSILKDGLLKDIPIISTLANLAKFGASLKDKLLAKKVLSFLVQLKDVDIEKRKEMIDDINKSDKYRIRVGEKLLYILDHCSDHIMAQILGAGFRDYLEDEISYDTFLKISNILENISFPDLTWFSQSGCYATNVEQTRDLFGTGLYELKLPNKIAHKFGVKEETELKVNMSEAGKEIVKLMRELVGDNSRRSLRKS